MLTVLVNLMHYAAVNISYISKQITKCGNMKFLQTNFDRSFSFQRSQFAALIHDSLFMYTTCKETSV